MYFSSKEDFLNTVYGDIHKNYLSENMIGYIDKLERIHDKASDKNKLDMLKRYYYDKYIIKKLPEDYINNEENLLENIQLKQKENLDLWLDYLLGSEANYPFWFKHYAFQGMIEMDNELLKSHNYNFIELNKTALSQVYDALYDYVEGEFLTKDQEESLAKGKKFGPVYIYYLNKFNSEKNNTKEKSYSLKKKTSFIKTLFGF